MPHFDLLSMPAALDELEAHASEILSLIRAVRVADDGDREEARRVRDARATIRTQDTIAPPAPGLMSIAAYVDCVTACRQFLALYDLPEPHDAAWRKAMTACAVGLVDALARTFPEARYPDGTPIAGAGCT